MAIRQIASLNVRHSAAHNHPMPDQNVTSLAGTQKCLRMGRCIVKLLPDNAPPDAIDKLHMKWMDPWERVVREMDRGTLREHPGDQGPQP